MAFINNESIVGIKTSLAEFTPTDLKACEVRMIDDTRVQVILNHKVYIITLEQVSPDLRQYKLQLGPDRFEVGLIRYIDRLVQKMGLNKTLQTRVEDLKAPMPGLVKKILVNEGDEVIMGQNLLLLEAMKMENVIKSPQTGKIKHISIAQHQTVDKGQLLIKFEL